VIRVTSAYRPLIICVTPRRAGAPGSAAAANLPAKPTPADVFTALYALPKNDTLSGLTAPLNFHKGAPASQVTCFFLGQISSGKLTAPKGTAPICP
jgi:hypothetical protein